MVRPLNVDHDAERYAVLAGQLGYPVTVEEVRPRLAAEMARSDKALFVWDEPGFGVAGWIGCQIESGAYYGRRGDVSGLVVDEAFRSRGLGRALLARAEQWFRDQGLESVRVRSGGQRLDAHRFYEREGYQRIKSQAVFLKSI